MRFSLALFAYWISLQLAAAQTELITNGTFQSGSTGWVLSGNFYADSRFSNCRSCPGYAYVSNPDGTPGNNLLGNMYQTVSIPANVGSVSLTFWYYITTQETGSTPYDSLVVTIQNSGGVVLDRVVKLTNLNATTGYVSSSPFSLMNYRGQTIRINFNGRTDGSLPTVFRIDDVSVVANVCSYSIYPTSQSFPSNGGSGYVNVSALSGCSWTAVSNSNWITITSGSSGTGNGTVGYSVAANNGPYRTGTMTIAGQTFTVNQDGLTCTYSINPTSQSFGPGGGTGTVGVTAGTNCSWSAVSNATWISITSGSSGTGNGTVGYSVAANNGPNRTGRMTIAGQTFTVNQAGATQTFIWPVNNPSVSQAYGCRGCLTSGSDRYNAGINVHTGADVYGPGAAYTVPVFATSDGWIHRLIFWGPASHGLGNTVILRHSNGKYSLYGHLDSIYANLSIGQFVPQGTPIGIMGHSSSNYRRDPSFGVHVHFEIKDYGVLGNQSDDGPYWGYTPGHPDFYGYTDPRLLVEGISIQSIQATALQNPPPGNLNVRSSPGTTYYGSTQTPVAGIIGAGQRVVATKTATIDGATWYFIDLPSRNSPFEGSPYPNNGPHGGWISGAVALPDPSAAQIRVVAPEYNVRSAPGTNNMIIARAYSGQRFVTFDSPLPGTGCSGSWHKIYVPGNNLDPPTVGWICRDGIVTDVAEGSLPDQFTLEQNSPNPFNSSTKIGFKVHVSGLATLKVYDVLGREVATLVNEKLQPGSYEVTFYAAGLSSGVYLYRLSVVPATSSDLFSTSGRSETAGAFVQTKHMVLLK